MSQRRLPPSKDSSFTGILRRFTSALRTRGVLRTAQSIVSLAADTCSDTLFDLRNGIETGGIRDLAALDITSSNREKGSWYQPIPVRLLRRLLERIPEGSRAGFVDFGSGKGRALFMAHRYGFREAVGVEFATELHEQASENLRRFEARIRKKSGISTVHMDATGFELEPEHTVFYFYNPFGSEVLAPVLSNIEKSLRDAPRAAWLIYANPVHHDLVDRMPGFEEERREMWRLELAIVYRFDPPERAHHDRTA